MENFEINFHLETTKRDLLLKADRRKLSSLPHLTILGTFYPRDKNISFVDMKQAIWP